MIGLLVRNCSFLRAKLHSQQSTMANFPLFQTTEGEWTSGKLWDILGVKIPLLFTQDPASLADFICHFETRPEDVFVVAYPKSGSWIIAVMIFFFKGTAVTCLFRTFVYKHSLDKTAFYFAFFLPNNNNNNKTSNNNKLYLHFALEWIEGFAGRYEISLRVRERVKYFFKTRREISYLQAAM